MRLLFVSHSFAPLGRPLDNVGGMQRVAMDLHAQLGKHAEVELHSLVLHSSWKWIVPRAVPFLASLVTRLPAAVKQHQIDAVLFSSMTTALPAMSVAKRVHELGATLSAICHGLDVTEPNALYQAGVRKTLQKLDAVLPVSHATAETCVRRGMDPTRVHVVPNGIELERFDDVLKLRQSPDPVSLEGLPQDAFLCISVGRQVRRKGFAWFVEHVMPQLPENVHYWLAGSGPECAAISEAVTRAGLHNRVRVLGLVDDVQLRQLYARANLFVMPNILVPGDMEGFGVVMLEAGACGVPTLAADMEGIRDVITHGQNGLFAPSENAAAFTEHILRLLQNPDELHLLAQRSADTVRTKFSWSQVAETYRKTIADVQPRS